MSTSSLIKGLPKPKPVTVSSNGGGGGSTESIRDFFPAAPKKTSRPELELLTAPNVFPKPSAPQGDVLPPSMRAQAQIIKSRAENLTKAAAVTTPPGALSSSSSSVAPPQVITKKVVEAPPVKKQQSLPPPPPPPAKAPLVSKPGLTEAEARAAAIAVVQARKEAAAAAAAAAPATKPAKKKTKARDVEGYRSDEYDSMDEKYDEKERTGVDLGVLSDDVSDEDFLSDDDGDDDDNYGIDNQIAEDDDDDGDADADEEEEEEEEEGSGEGADGGDGETADPMDVDQEGEEEQSASNDDDAAQEKEEEEEEEEDDGDADDDNEREPDDLAALTTFLVNERLTKKQRAALPVLTTTPSAAPPSPPVKKAPPPSKPAVASAPKAKAGAAAQVDTLATCYKRYGIDAPIPTEVETELHFAMRTMQEYYNKILVSASFAKTQSAPAAQSVGTRLAPVLEVRARNSRDLNKSMLYMQSLVEEGLEEMDTLIAY